MTLTSKSCDSDVLVRAVELSKDIIDAAVTLAQGFDGGAKQLARFGSDGRVDHSLRVSKPLFNRYVTLPGGEQIIFQIQGVLAEFQLFPIARRVQGDVSQTLRRKVQSVDIASSYEDTAFRDAQVAVQNLHGFLEGEIPSLKALEMRTLPGVRSLRAEKRLLTNRKYATAAVKDGLASRLDPSRHLAMCNTGEYVYTEDNHVNVGIMNFAQDTGIPTLTPANATVLKIGDIVDVGVSFRASGNTFEVVLEDIILMNTAGSEVVSQVRGEVNLSPKKSRRIITTV